MADVARLQVYFEGDTSDLDRAYARAKKQQTDYMRWMSRQGDVELDADASPLEREVRDAQRTISRYRTTATKNAQVLLGADGRPLDRDLRDASTRLTRWKTGAGKSSLVNLQADPTGVQRGVDRAQAALNTLPNQKEVNLDVDTGGAAAKVGAVTAAIGGGGGGGRSFTSAIIRAGTLSVSIWRVAIPAAIGTTIAALSPLVGGGLAGGGLVAGVVGGFGLIYAAGNETFSKLEVEGGRLVAKTGVNLTRSQQKLVNNLNTAADKYRKALEPANAAFNRFAARIVARADNIFKPLGRAAEETTTAVGRAFEDVLDTLSKPIQVRAFDRILNSMPRISSALTRAGGNLFGGLSNMLAEAAPFAEDLARYIERITGDFLKWTQSEKGRQQIRRFLQTAADIGPPVARAIGQMAWGLLRISANPQVQTVLRGVAWGLEMIGKGLGGASRLLGWFNKLDRAVDRLLRAGIKRVWEQLDLKWEGSALQRLVRRINQLRMHPFRTIRESWEDLDIRWEGSALQRLWQATVKGVRWMSNTHERIIRGLGNWLQKTWQRMWQGVANFLVDRARGMVRTLSNFRRSAGNWVRSLVPNVVNFWKDRVWQPAADFLANRSQGMSNTLSNFKTRSVSWVKSLPSAIGRLWERFWQGAADFVVKKKDGILDTMSNLVDGVVGRWNDLIGFINKVLSAVNLPTINIGGGSSGGGSNPGGTRNDDTIAPNQMGRARGGIDSGLYSDPTGRTLLRMAKGGALQGPHGGVAATGPRVVYGEAGPEAYVTLGRFTKESANALRVANETWARKGWDMRLWEGNPKAPSVMQYGGLKGVIDDSGSGLGPFGPTKNSLWTNETFGRVLEVLKNFTVSANTYVGHGSGNPGDTADFWGMGGRGDPIPLNMNNKVRSFIQSRLYRGLSYMLSEGDAGHSGGSRHVHATWAGPDPTVPNIAYQGGQDIGGGGFLQSLWDSVGQAIWNRLVQPVANTFQKWMGGGNFVLRQAAGSAGSMALDSIKEWIISKAGGSGTSGSSALGGDPAKNRSLGEQMLKSSGVPGSFSALDKLWMAESAWDRFAENPSSGAYGIPQALPPTKLPAAGQKSGGSKAGPQIDWGLSYIRDRYGSTDKAWSAHQSQGWYHRGGVIPGPRGRPMLVQAHAGERVLPAELTRSFDKLADSVEKWGRSTRQHRGGFSGISIGPQGVSMPGLSVSARGVQINPRQLHRGAYAQEDAARTLRALRKDIQTLDKKIGREVQEGVRRNVERGLETNRSLDKSDARRLARQLAGGPRISRAL